MSQIGSLPVFNALTGLLPCEGAKGLSYSADFSAAQEYDFDFTIQYQNKVFTAIQCVWIDNADSASVAILIVNGSGQRIVAPANSQGYYTLLATSPPKFQFLSAGGVIVPIDFLNFYVPPTVWKTV